MIQPRSTGPQAITSTTRAAWAMPVPQPTRSPSLAPVAVRNREATAARRIVFEQSTAHAGPLPAPETLAAYDALLPGLADRIVTLAEGYAKHVTTHEANMLAAAKERMRWDGVSELAGVG